MAPNNTLAWSTTNATSSAVQPTLGRGDPTINTSTFVAGYNYVLFENVVATAGGVIIFTADAAEPGDGLRHRDIAWVSTASRSRMPLRSSPARWTTPCPR